MCCSCAVSRHLQCWVSAGLSAIARLLAAAEFETVILKDGQRVTGEVVAEKPTRCTSTSATTSCAFRATRSLRRAKVDEADRRHAKPSRGDRAGYIRLLHDGRAEASPVKELVGKFGEAVISIETPSGKGSGFIINKEGYAITNAHVIQGETRVSAILYMNAPGGLDPAADRGRRDRRLESVLRPGPAQAAAARRT